MAMTWLRDAIRGQALHSGTREVERFVNSLEAMGDRDIGNLVAVATAIRINLETHAVIPEGVFHQGALPSAEALGLYQMHMNKLVRQFNRMGNMGDATAVTVWSYSLRCLNVPELLPLGRRMWAELKRGFPYVEQALKDGEDVREAPLPSRVWEQWDMVPAGLAPPDDGGEG